MTIIRAGVLGFALAATALVVIPTSSLAQKKQRDRITRDEIMNSAHRDLDLYQVIRNLRPQFLQGQPGTRSMGGSSGGGIAVYVDGKRDTGIDALRVLMASEIEEVRYLDPSQSQSEYGPRARSGAIVVKLFKGPKLAVTDSTKPPR
jgi:hypothetical protein